MGHRYGFAIYSSHPIRDHLVERPLLVQRGTPVREVLEKALSRQGKDFNDDVVLVGQNQEYVGIIPVPTLVQLQSALVAEKFRLQEAMHRRLLAISRQAGMAEVATGVLHNVGNVLNSVNVSATLVSDLLRKSKVSSLEKATALLEKHGADLGTYLTEDEKGKVLPELLIRLAERLRGEQAEALKELESLTKSVGHIKNIVAMQQSYAKVSGLLEPVSVSSLVEDALELNADAFARHGIRVERQFEEVPRVMVDRHKVLQILINLLRNGKYALDQGNGQDKRLLISIALPGGQRVQIKVQDNGIGILPENLDRIFNHGFTTKKEGHGFGLHSCALAAKEMGGALTGLSGGLGTGATFILELPIEQPKKSK
jgi:signal transduction histidine kinase